MVCCRGRSSVATTNERINLSELHSAPPDSKRPAAGAAERGESVLVRDSLSLSLSPQPDFLWPPVSNERTRDSSSVSQSPAFVFRKPSKTRRTRKDYQADFHQTYTLLTIQGKIPAGLLVSHDQQISKYTRLSCKWHIPVNG